MAEDTEAERERGDERDPAKAAVFRWRPVERVADSVAMTATEKASEPAVTRWTRSTVYADMWVDPGDDLRESEVAVVGERGTLLEYLRRYRLTLEMKCEGLDPEQLARRSVPPSTMSLLGLVRHLADVERSWFRRVMARADASPRYWSQDVPTLTGSARLPTRLS